MVFDVLLDRRCPGCGGAHRAICGACVNRLERRRWTGGPITVPADGPGLPVTALFVYDDLVARIVLAAKNGGHRRAAGCLGEWLGRAVTHRFGVDDRPDLVTWVPASPLHLRRRPYDQGELLARSVARRLGVPARRLLRRRDRRTQANLARPDRLRGPALTARSGSRRPGSDRPGRVLLVDDVTTTGASLARAGEALAAAGHLPVGAAVAAVSL
ncbi:MAG: ComF family protein [Acidimicrobiales bacterium]